MADRTWHFDRIYSSSDGRTLIERGTVAEGGWDGNTHQYFGRVFIDVQLTKHSRAPGGPSSFKEQKRITVLFNVNAMTLRDAMLKLDDAWDGKQEQAKKVVLDRMNQLNKGIQIPGQSDATQDPFDKPIEI